MKKQGEKIKPKKELNTTSSNKGWSSWCKDCGFWFCDKTKEKCKMIDQMNEGEGFRSFGL